MVISQRLRKLLTLGAVLALTAAAACDAYGEDPAPQNPANTPAVVSGAPAGPAKTPAVVDGEVADAEVEAAARRMLAAEIGEGAFRLLSYERVQWPDASLGCPEEGYAYAQVITPGHKLLFDLDGADYPVHSNADGSHMVICGEDG